MYLSEGNYYAEVGSFVHEILADVLEGKLPIEEAEQYYRDNFEENVCYKAPLVSMNNTFSACADYLASLSWDNLGNYEILGVEKKVLFKVGRHNFIGFIDLLLRDKRDGKIVVVDHKSSEYPFKKDGNVKKSSQKSLESYKRQMYLYCHAVRQIYGEFPKEIAWNHFKSGGRIAKIPFVDDEYQIAIKWFKSTIRKIEKETDYEPSESYFYCSNLCNFRNSCEYITLGGANSGEI